jgi:hypothetical protein
LLQSQGTILKKKVFQKILYRNISVMGNNSTNINKANNHLSLSTNRTTTGDIGKVLALVQRFSLRLNIDFFWLKLSIALLHASSNMHLFTFLSANNSRIVLKDCTHCKSKNTIVILWDPINWFSTATFLCLSKASTFPISPVVVLFVLRERWLLEHKVKVKMFLY